MSDIVGALPPPRTYVIVIPGHPLSANGLVGTKLKDRMADTRTFRDAVALESRRLYNGPPFPHAEVTYTLVRTDTKWYDRINASSVTKRLEDGLCVKHGGTFLLADTEADVTTIIRQARGLRREVRIEIRGPLPRPTISYADERPAETAGAPRPKGGARRARAH